MLGPLEVRLDRRYEPITDTDVPELGDPVFGRVLALIAAMAGSTGARLAVGPLSTAVLTYEGAHVAFAPLPDGGAWVVISPASAQPGLVLSHLRRRLGELAQPDAAEPNESR